MTLIFKIQTALVTSAAIVFASTCHAQDPVPPGTVIVSNAQVTITYEDLIAEMERLPEENRTEFLLSEKRVAIVVENMLINKMMTAEAQKSGLQNNPKAAAEIRNLTEKVLAKYRREEIEAQLPKIDLLPLAREIFLTRMKDLERPAYYTSWHTLIKSKERTRETMLDRAKLVKAKADAGEPLDEIAKQYSDDESAPFNGGYINATPLANLDWGFGSALEKLKVNESTVVETEYGVHVVRLLKMTPKNRPAFDDVKDVMLVEANKTYKQRAVENYLRKLRGDPSIKLNTDALNQIRPRLPEIPPPPTAKELLRPS